MVISNVAKDKEKQVCDHCDTKEAFISILDNEVRYYLCLQCIDRIGDDAKGMIAAAKKAIVDRMIAKYPPCGDKVALAPEDEFDDNGVLLW